MEEKRLPRNAKEGILYGGIIAIITALVMMFLNISTSYGRIDLEVIKKILCLTPIMWVLAMLLESLIVGRISEKLVDKFCAKTDSFNARILFNILFCVTMMSAIMTIVGGMIGMGKISIEPIKMFFHHWPRNFCVAFWCEILLAQPAARKVMTIIHKKFN